MLWHIGNTTVRTPYRIRDALVAMDGSRFNGNIIGRERENGFAALLHASGVLHSDHVEEGEDASNLGRKWRVAMSQLGFITPALTGGLEPGATDQQLLEYTELRRGYTGRPYEITENGRRLIESESLAAQQACFLRALRAYRIPSALEPRYARGDNPPAPFSPLLQVIRICQHLRERTEESTISFDEFALFVQTSTPEDGASEIAGQIQSLRNDVDGMPRHSRERHLSEMFERVADDNAVKVGTIDDYADLSIRYLKATGLFVAAGRNGMAMSPIKRTLWGLLAEEADEPEEDRAHLSGLWRGAALPTDDLLATKAAVEELLRELRSRGEAVVEPHEGAEQGELERHRLELEEHLRRLLETQYAEDQANRHEEIAAWLMAIASRRGGKLPDGQPITVPRGEHPAYLEWAVWRAFLAIDSLSNAPWEARRFEVDQDFLPVHCAPAGGPDMVLEFDAFTIVVEVTLTSSSRQEAAEGEPVRRHVAKIANDKDKPVYGLFIAITIDSNTAHTFRLGDWYLPDDTKQSLQIVPLRLTDFTKILMASQAHPQQAPQRLRDLIIQCRSVANEDAPAWKASISRIVEQHVAAT